MHNDMHIHSHLNVSEIFYSIQGEGQTMGTPAFFLRLSACNLLCGGYGTQNDGKLHQGATWRCDTIEVWTKGRRLLFSEVYEELERLNFTKRMRNGAHLIVTGGEPLLQYESLVRFFAHLELCTGMQNLRDQIEVETNGTLEIGPKLRRHVKYWNVSPKLSNSGMPKEKRINGLALMSLDNGRHTIFKFVVSREEDWTEIKRDFLHHIKREQIVLMPAAGDRIELHLNSELVAEICKRECIKMCSRLHVTIWNKLTGV